MLDQPAHERKLFEADGAVVELAMSPKNPGAILWLTGLSGAGKSTLSQEMRIQLERKGVSVAILDGDQLRSGLNSDLGFSLLHREENVRRTAEVARLFTAYHPLVIVALVSPTQKIRDTARTIARGLRFWEIFIDTPLSICEARDAKGLYARSRRGELVEFTGLSSPYEIPLNPDLRLAPASPAEQAVLVLKFLDEHR